MHRGLTLLVALSMLLVLPPAIAHSDRTVEFPDGDDTQPEYRTSGPALVVCPDGSTSEDFELERNKALADECDYHLIQNAVDDVTERGTRILLLPGLYDEAPPLSPACQDTVTHADEEGRGLNYEEQADCPTAENLVGVYGDDPHDGGNECGDDPDEVLCDLQIEGTGASPSDVVIDARFEKDMVIRADRADGFYLTNVTVQRGEDDAVLVHETDGFVLDELAGRWNPGYGLNVFISDHGLISDCEAVGNGDSGVYLGAMPELRGARPTATVERCNVHHNALGYSGTAGNSVLVRDNAFHHNGAGIAMDSVFPGHPGQPQDSGTFVGNEIYSNNVNYYDNFLGEDPPCEKPVEEQGWSDGVVCPTVPIPVGTGILVAGGNDNLFADNDIYDNWRYGAMLFSVPKALRQAQAGGVDTGSSYGHGSGPSVGLGAANQVETSHNNRFVSNTMGIAPDGSPAPNGIDFWWDEGGTANCWEGNDGGSDGIESNPIAPLLPGCEDPRVHRPQNVVKSASIASCATYSESNHHPLGCRWMHSPDDPTDDEEEILGWDPAPTQRVGPDSTLPAP